MTRDAAPRLAGLLICVAAFLPYLAGIDDYFIRDDFGVVQLLAAKPALYFPTWFHTSWMDFIWGFTPDEVRPFTALSYQLTAFGDDGSPVLHHLLNIAVHAGNSVAVMLLASRVARVQLPFATLAGVLFAVLPVNAESVAWITGRVDSMPAFFYLAAFLFYAHWRERGSPVAYGAAVAFCFAALFSKQNTITMLATLLAYDLLVAPRPFRPVWRRLVAYLPFAILTVGYLALRWALFGEVAREGKLDERGLELFGEMAAHHAAHVVAGSPEASWLMVAGVAGLVALAALGGTRTDPGRIRQLVFFGPVWWAIGVAPLLVAGYESPRHVYLAAVGWAVVVALALESLGGLRVPRSARRAALAAGVAAVLIYGVRLTAVVGWWSRLAATSEAAVRTVESSSLAAPPGALIIAGVPSRSWEWAVPFALRPPFTSEDVTARSFVIAPRELHCCPQQWFDDTRRVLDGWSSGPARDVVIALRWDLTTGEHVAMTTSDTPDLPVVARMLRTLPSGDLLDETLRRLLESAGPARQTAR